MMLFLHLTHSWEWTKLTPTANQPEDFPHNITAGVLEDQSLLRKVFLLMGHREIWSVTSGSTITFSNDVFTYDIENNRWSKLSVSSKPTARAYSAGVGLFNRIYFYGGSTFGNDYGDINLFDDFWYYDTISNTFTQITQGLIWPGPRSSARLFSVADKLYLFGGIKSISEYGLPVYTNELWQFDISSGIWTLITTEVGDPVPSSRGVPQAFQLVGQLYINGGELFNPETFGFETPSDTWRFSSLNDKWHNTQKPLLPARSYAASFRIGFQWGIYGGEIDSGTPLDGCGAPFPQNVDDELWIYIPLLNIWQHKSPSGTKPPPLKRAMAVGFGLTNAYLFSGFSFDCVGTGPGQVYNNAIYKLTI